MTNEKLSVEDIQWIKTRIEVALLREERAKAHFVRSILEIPEFVTVTVDEWRVPNLNLTSGHRGVWLVVKDDPQSVFFDEKLKQFGACWGPDRDTGELIDLGFRDDDPYRMYVA